MYILTWSDLIGSQLHCRTLIGRVAQFIAIYSATDRSILSMIQPNSQVSRSVVCLLADFIDWIYLVRRTYYTLDKIFSKLNKTLIVIYYKKISLRYPVHLFIKYRLLANLIDRKTSQYMYVDCYRLWHIRIRKGQILGVGTKPFLVIKNSVSFSFKFDLWEFLRSVNYFTKHRNNFCIL